MPKKPKPHRQIPLSQMERVREIDWQIRRFTKNPHNEHFRVTDSLLARSLNVEPTKPSAKKHVRISTRQVQRDRRVLERLIAQSESQSQHRLTLRDAERLNLYEPALKYSSKHRSYIYTRDVDLSGLLGKLGDEKLGALLVAQKALAVFSGMPLAAKVREIFEEDAGGLTGNRNSGLAGDITALIRFHPDGAALLDQAVFATIFRGLMDRRQLDIRYQGKLDEAPRVRRVHPYHLECVRQQWRLIALDAEKNALRTFIVTPRRMLEATLTDESFERPPTIESSAESERKKERTERIEVRFARDGKHYVLERQWSWLRTHPTPEGDQIRATFHVPARERGEFERFILSFGRDCEVLAPRALRDWFRTEAQAMVNRYSI